MSEYKGFDADLGFRLKQNKKKQSNEEDNGKIKENKENKEKSDEEKEKDKNTLISDDSVFEPSPLISEEERKDNIRTLNEGVRYLETPTKLVQQSILFRI